MSECHIWVWGENCAIWVVSRKGEGIFTETTAQRGQELGLQSQPVLSLPFWLCHVPAVGLLESQLTSPVITSSSERWDQ